MPIRQLWEQVVTAWKPFRPSRRRRSLARFFAETFEPRRLLSAFVVNNLGDSHDALLGDGIAADANGFTTLRAALEEANVSNGADTITLPAGVVTLSAENGPLSVNDNVTIVGSGASTIAATVFDEVFAIHGTAQLNLHHVTVISADVLAASLRPALLTTNARQADLVVAFSATQPATFAADLKTSNGLSPLNGITVPEIVLETTPTLTEPKRVTFDDSAVPTPEQAIDQIINALFRSVPGFVLPAGASREPGPISEESARPMSKSDSDEKSSPMSPATDTEPTSEFQSSGAGASSERLDDDSEVGAILRGWAEEAGWQEFNFLTRGVSRVAKQPRPSSRLAVIAGTLIGGIFTNSWSRAQRESWRDSLSWSFWPTRFERPRLRLR